MLRPELLSPERTTDSQAQHLFQLQEEMRLAYTAMTRARLRVVWTATDAGVDQGDRRPSRFIVAASDAHKLSDLGPPHQVVRDPVTISEAETALRRDLLNPDASISKRLSAAAVLAQPSQPWWDPDGFAGVAPRGPDAPILGDHLRLSPSQADSYKRCPRQYALERRLRLGDGASPYAHFGSLVHDALERAEKEILGTGKTHADLDQALTHLANVWVDASFGTPELNAAWHDKAIEAVTKLYEKWPSPDGIPVALETRVESVINDIQWLGVIDRIEETPEGFRIVDYKTSTQAMSLADAAESIQLAFYTTAVRDGGREVSSAQLWYPRTRDKTVATRDLDMDRIDGSSRRDDGDNGVDSQRRLGAESRGPVSTLLFQTVMSGLARRIWGLSAMTWLTPSPEQQDILDLGLTTIRVRAGAGTGKTTTVAMVIANLVENHQIEPEQVLGITFTNKAGRRIG